MKNHIAKSVCLLLLFIYIVSCNAESLPITVDSIDSFYGTWKYDSFGVTLNGEDMTNQFTQEDIESDELMGALVNSVLTIKDDWCNIQPSKGSPEVWNIVFSDGRLTLDEELQGENAVSFNITNTGSLALSITLNSDEFEAIVSAYYLPYDNSGDTSGL